MAEEAAAKKEQKTVKQIDDEFNTYAIEVGRLKYLIEYNESNIRDLVMRMNTLHVEKDNLEKIQKASAAVLAEKDKTSV